jgi:hypothetical protein
VNKMVLTVAAALALVSGVANAANITGTYSAIGEKQCVTGAVAYNVAGDEYTRSIPSDGGTFTTGPKTGLTNTISHEEPLNGAISENTPHVLLKANSQPTLKTWTFGSGEGDNAYCSINRTLTKVRAIPPAAN